MTLIARTLSALTLSLLTLSVVNLPLQAGPSQTPQRGARLITNQMDLSWVLLEEPNSDGHWGYVCLTSNRLMAIASTSYIARYAITAQGRSQLTLEPVAAVKLLSSSQGRGVRPTDRYWVEAATPMPEAEIWQIVRERSQLMRRAFQPGLVRETNPDELGQACVDGGITGAIDWTEQINGITIEDRRGQQASAQPVPSPIEVIPPMSERYGPQWGLIRSQDAGSPVNVRYGPGLNYEVQHIGYAGDELRVDASRIDAEGRRWYWGRFNESGATGWIREDFIDVWSDNVPPSFYQSP